MQMEIEVKGQRIKRINSPGSVEDTLNYLTCHFTFDGSEWENTIKTAYFKNRATEKIYSSLIADDGTCTVPWESLTDKGFVEFSAAGERENYRITTGIESFYNSETVYGGEPSEPPTPSQYDQLIALAEQTKEIAESVREDADAGEFDGEPGKPGDPGKDGVSPTAKVDETNDGAVITVTDATGTTTAKLKNGKDGNPGQDATDEQVQSAVEAYMAEHPVQVDTDDLIKIAIKEEVSGAVPIVTTDSAEMGVQDLTMQGWTEQESTTGANLIDYSQAIPRNENQSVEIIDGGVKWTGDYYFIISVTGLEKNQTYTMHYVSDDAGVWIFGYTDGTYSSQRPNGGAGTTDPEKDCDKVFIYKSNPTVSGQDMVFTDIMLNAGSTALPYEPYTGGKPSPNPDYPQEIVSAGDYDELTGKYRYEVKLTGANLWNAEEAADTSKWVASTSQSGYYEEERTDFQPYKNQTVTLTADRPLTKWDRLEKQNGQWGWVYKSAEIVLDGSERTWRNYPTYKGYFCTELPFSASRREGYAENIIVDTSMSKASTFSCWLGVNNNFVYVINAPQYDANLPDRGIQNWRDWLSENPLTILTYLDEETFVPLSETEQEQMNALHTFRPTTVLSNDCECEMTIKYIADTKAYIDSKIAAIQAAIVNTI